MPFNQLFSARRLFRTGWMLAATLIVISSQLSPISIAYGQFSGWTQPSSLGYGWFPDIVTDPAGGVHVAWSGNKVIKDSGTSNTDQSTGYDVVMYTTTPDGQKWTKANDIAASEEVAGSEVTRPALSVSPDGLLLMTYKHSSIYFLNSPVETASSAQSWQAPEVISENQIAYYSRIAIDNKGSYHVVYTQNVPTATCPICFHIYYRRSDDKGLSWTPPEDISLLDTGSAKPQILIDQNNNIHVVWESGVGGALGQLSDPTSVKYAASYDGGKTWTQPIQFPAPNGWSRNITIGLDGNGKLVVAWLGLQEDLIYYQVSNDFGKSWSDPQPINGVWGGWSVYNARLDDYSMATDSDGNIHLVFVGRTSSTTNNLSLIHLVWDGSSWSVPDSITTLVGDVPEWPRIAISLGNQLNVVWFVREKAHIWDSDNNSYQVWFASKLISAHAIQPLPIPTIITTPEPQVTPTLTIIAPAKPNPSLAAIPDSPPGSTDIYSETSNMIMIAKGLLPGLLFMGIVLFVIRIRRKG